MHSVGDPVATKCGCQYRKCDISATSACFQAGPSLGFVGGRDLSDEPEFQSVAWLIFGEMFLVTQGCYFQLCCPFALGPPTHTRVEGKTMMI